MAMGLYATAFEREGRLDRLEAFASHNGADFYGLPRNSGEPAAPDVVEGKGGMGWLKRAQSQEHARRRCIAPTPLPLADTVTLVRKGWEVPASYTFGEGEVVPMWAGQTCDWSVE